MRKKSFIILFLLCFFLFPKIIFSDDFIQLGDTKKKVLKILGALTRVSKYLSSYEERWTYGFSSITFKNGRVYEYSGAKHLKIKLLPKKLINGNEKKPISADFGSNPDEVLYVLGTPDRISRYPSLNEEIWTYGFSSITFKNGRVIDTSKLSDYTKYKIKDYSKNLYPHVAENGSYYGEISKLTGRPKTVYVRGYFRKNGTYVSSHYRSKPRRK